jgi:hypothetical protein
VKESNKMPGCALKDEECEYCCGDNKDFRKAYLVIQVENRVIRSAGTWSEVFVAELSLKALEVLASILPYLASADGAIRQRGIEAIEDDCASDPLNKDCMFMLATFFSGLDSDRNNWFLGLTHAPRAVTQNGEPWLKCPYDNRGMLRLRLTLDASR